MPSQSSATHAYNRERFKVVEEPSAVPSPDRGSSADEPLADTEQLSEGKLQVAKPLLGKPTLKVAGRFVLSSSTASPSRSSS
jgi:hypothetical protein